jgi:ABC-2 type transport system permease protein
MSFSFRTAWRIAGAETRMSVRDRRASLACLSLIIALAATTLAGMRDFEERQRVAMRTAEAEYQRWLNQGTKSSHSAAHFGQFVFPESSPVSALESGVGDYQGSFVFLEAHTQKLWQFRPAEDRTFLFRFANVDVGFVMEIVLPLLIVLLLFGAIAGERESGTLQQILASGVSISSVAAGKTMAVALLFGFVLVPYLAFAASWVAAQSVRPPDDLTRLALLTATWIAYWWISAVLSIVVSARARSSKQALIWLLPSWFVLSLAAPPAAAHIAGLVAPSMDGLTFAAAIQSDRYKLPVWYDRLDKTEKRLLAQYSVTDLRRLPVSPAGVAMVEDEEAYDKLQEQRFRSLYGDWERQARAYALLGLIAPSLAVSSASLTVAGTDVSHSRHFAAASERYRQYLVQAMNKAMITGQRPDALPYAPGYTPGAEPPKSPTLSISLE